MGQFGRYAYRGDPSGTATAQAQRKLVGAFPDANKTCSQRAGGSYAESRGPHTAPRTRGAQGSFKAHKGGKVPQLVPAMGAIAGGR